MYRKLIELRNKEMIHPHLLGIFINPFYIIRRGLYLNVKANAKYLKGKLLDFGCGNKPFKDLFGVDEYIGLDLEQSDNIEVNQDADVSYDGKTIPFDDNHFDSILASEVFEHVFNIDEILIEIHRVCKPNGYLLLTVPFIWDEHEVPFDYGRYTSYGIRHLIIKHGFEIVYQKKTTNYVETIFQMWNAYVYKHIFKHPLAKLLLTPIFIAPITILGLIISKILPQNYNFFHNNIILAKKI